MPPFFDYLCTNSECENIEEVLLVRSELDTKEVLCSKCQSVMKRLISSPPFKFAGEPPRDWKPRKTNNPKSEVRNIHEIRRVQETK